MARVYYGIPKGYTGSNENYRRQLLISNKPVYYVDHTVYMFDIDGKLYTKRDIDYCEEVFPSIKIGLSRLYKYVSVQTYKTLHSETPYETIQYINDCIQMNDGVATHDWGGAFRSKLRNAQPGTSIADISPDYTEIDFEDVADEEIECRETEKFINYLSEAISEQDEGIKYIKESPSKTMARKLPRLEAEQENRKTLLGALVCKLEFNGRRTWAPYITRTVDIDSIDKEKRTTHKPYISEKKSKEQKEMEEMKRTRACDIPEMEKYSNIDNLTLQDFVLIIGNPTFDRYQDGYSISAGIDHIEVELSVRSVGLNYEKQVQCFKKFMKEIDRLVATRIKKSGTFISSELKINYFDVNRILTHQSLIVYQLNLKDQYKGIKQGKITIDKSQKRRTYIDEIDSYI